MTVNGSVADAPTRAFILSVLDVMSSFDEFPRAAEPDEVDLLFVRASPEEEVGGLQVPVGYAEGVEVLQPGDHLVRQHEGGLQ